MPLDYRGHATLPDEPQVCRCKCGCDRSSKSDWPFFDCVQCCLLASSGDDDHGPRV